MISRHHVTMLKYQGRIRFEPHYLDPEASKNFQDLTLVSKDRKKYSLNSCLFAALSRSCFRMVASASNESGKFTILTEHSGLELYKFKMFVTTGKFFGYQGTQELLSDHETITTFRDFGIDLKSMRFSYSDNAPWWKDMVTDYQQPLPPPLIKDPWDGFEAETKGGGDEWSDNEGDVDRSTFSKEEPIENSNDEHEAASGMVDDKSGLILPGSVKVELDYDYYSNYDEMPLMKLKQRTNRKRKLSNEVLRNISNDEDDPDFDPGLDVKVVKKKSKPTEKKKAGRLKKDKVEGRPKGPKSGPCSGSLKAGPKKWGILKDDETSVKFKNREDAIFYFPQDESLRDPSLRFHCTLCVRGFDVGKMLRQHFRRHSAKSEKDKYFCIYCTEYVAFLTSKELKAHEIAKHKDMKMKCPHCPKTFKKENRWHMDQHINHAHANFLEGKKRKLAQCHSCGVELENKLGLAGHLRLYGKLHDGKCRICPDFQSESWEENLKHYNALHSGEIQYKCGHCVEWFKTTMQLKIHRRVCTFKASAEKPRELQTCDICGKASKNVDAHKEMVHGTGLAIPCPEPGCNQVSTSIRQAKSHEKIHRMMTCELCGYVGNLRSYDRHKRVKHTENAKKPYVCGVCGKGFNDKHAFQDHQNVHTGAKPYQCDLCPMAFASVGTFGGHRRAVHEGIKRGK